MSRKCIPPVNFQSPLTLTFVLWPRHRTSPWQCHDEPACQMSRL